LSLPDGKRQIQNHASPSVALRCSSKWQYLQVWRP
jgi:hypothetical protein